MGGWAATVAQNGILECRQSEGSVHWYRVSEASRPESRLGSPAWEVRAEEGRACVLEGRAAWRSDMDGARKIPYGRWLQPSLGDKGFYGGKGSSSDGELHRGELVK